ncbi:MAG TPA: type II toxin-antitoxin system RelE/ParE family toxin [Pyrinomonadaceae bacterium]|nr:type II toxin-antitoxin system RelE/ParE family toxin [Pyrinomonadaceae bacterium]
MPARFSVSFSRKAEQDLEEIWSFIAADSADNATRFILQLEAQVERLGRLPERCPLIPENELLRGKYRHLIYGDYRTVFRIASKTVFIIRIINSARLLDTSMI